jgi:cysteinyl-tRNA synthetase
MTDDPDHKAGSATERASAPEAAARAADRDDPPPPEALAPGQAPLPPALSNPCRPGPLGLVGNTPLVPILRLNPNPGVEIWAKLEKANPGGSVKERIALAMIEAGERSGELTAPKTILEATSGNTGIGLAMVAAAKGYRITLAMSEGVSEERRKILSAFGAELLLTPAAEGTDGAIERVYELVAEHPDRYFLTDQYNNPANVLAHYHGTAPEIWQQTGGRISHFVATIGTTGTVMGCSRRLRELDPRVRIIGVEPYLGHKIQGLKNLKEAYVPGIFDPAALDEKINIDDDAAYEMARRLAREEGLLVGMSSGAAMHVAAQVAAEIDRGVLVVMFPDGGERYLSTPLYQVTAPEAVVARLKFFNTLGGRYQAFEPLSGNTEVTMYSCGPTVHARPHLGLMRRMLAADLARRTLEYIGYRVRHVVSITDWDDNTEAAAEAAGEPMEALCARHEAEFHADEAALNLRPAETYVRSTESVDDMVRVTDDLVRQGFAYEKLRSVYFNIGRVDSYGELSSKDLGKIKLGATVDLDRYDKNDPRDFTLLRRSTLGEIRKGLTRKTQWGNVRPSWHIQCSAMARAQLGEQFDIHTASSDLIFPHNENEIAQSRALTGESQARFWLHSELVLRGGKKMTYDEQTCVTLPDLRARGWSDREVRFLLLSSHYRQPVHLTDEQLESARASLRRIDECVRNLRAVRGEVSCVEEVDAWIVDLRADFRQALLDDLNISAALAAVFRFVRQLNYLMSEGRLCADHAGRALEALHRVDEVLACLPPEEAPLSAEIQELLAERDAARKAGDYATADRIRDQLEGQGYEVVDRPEGTRLTRRDNG